MKHALAAPTLADTTTPLYDANGNLTSRATGLGTTDYSYDALDRLKTEFGPGVDQSFGYDGNGNRLSDSANIYTIAPNGNRIQSINGITRIYDPAGNLLDDGQGKTYAYNAAGRLKEVRVNSVLVASYKYNYRGLRTHKITPEGTTLYHYDIQGRLVQTTDQAGVPRQSLHWAGDQPIAQVDHAPGGDKLVYLHTDHLNTPRTATDENGSVVWRWEGGAFGETLPNEDVEGDGNLTKIDLRYAGMVADSESGLFYNWHRYYDPKIGRYVSSDPIGLRGGLNTYSYVFNNPLRWTDPDGLEVRFICRPLAGVASLTGKQHCFVRVTCPEEGWATTLSLFGTNPNWLGLPRTGRKGRDDPRDDPNSPDNAYNQPVDPGQCPTNTCAYEKAVMSRYNSFPNGDVPYSAYGPNSNSFAQDLVTGAPDFPTILPPGAPGDGVAPGIGMPHPNFP